MKFHSFLRSARRWSRLVALSALLLPGLAEADAPTAVALEIDAALTTLDADAFTDELHEKLDLLGLEGGPKLGTLRVRADGDAVELTFVPNEGASVTRRLEATEGGLDPRTLAFAASHLVRDEASEILAGLQTEPSVQIEEPEQPAPVEAPEEPAVAEEPPPPPADPFACAGGRRIPIGVDFAPFVGTSSAAPDGVRSISFNLVGGHAKGLDGFELGLGFNYESDFACGMQIAGGANIVGGPVRGLQLAPVNVAGPVRGAQIGVVDVSAGDIFGAQIGTVSVGGGSVEGAQIGIVAIASGSVNGAQIGMLDITGDDIHGTQIGIGNIIGGDIRGTQIGIGNIVGGSTEGSQIGVGNIVGGDAKRLQMGVGNVTGGNVTGLQLGVGNIAGGDVDGAQIAVLNIAGGRVSKTQVGIFNYADEVDAPVGMFSVVRRGRTSIEAWGTADGIASVGIRHGGRHVHNVIGLDLPLGVEDTSWGFTFGIGTRVPFTERLHLDIDLLFTTLANESGHPYDDGAPQKYRLLFDFGYALGDGFGIFGGPSIDVARVENAKLSSPPWGSISLHEGKHPVHITPGLTIGARYDVQRIE